MSGAAPVNHANSVRVVVKHLSALIFNARTRLESERNFPGADTDRSEAQMAGLEQRVERLRQLREEFEDEMAGPQ